MGKNKKKSLAPFQEGLWIFFLILATLLFFGPSEITLAADPLLPLPTEPFVGFQNPGEEGDSGVEIAKSLTASIVDNVRFIIGAVAILMIIISSIRMITAEGNEETFNKGKQALVISILGLVVVGLAGEISQILTVEKGGFLRDPSKALQQIRIFDRSVRIVLTLMKYLIGSVAVLGIVRSGFSLITEGGTEEEVTKNKQYLVWSLLGLVFILIANPLINQVFYKIDVSNYPGTSAVRPGLDAKRGLAEIVGATNLVIKFVGPAAIFSLLGGGILYLVAGGDDEKINKAKKIMFWALIGIVIIYGAFGIVSTFVAGQFKTI